MSQNQSPFQVYVSTWWTKEDAETKHHEIVRKWNKMSMFEQSQYIEAARNKNMSIKHQEYSRFNSPSSHLMLLESNIVNL